MPDAFEEYTENVPPSDVPLEEADALVFVGQDQDVEKVESLKCEHAALMHKHRLLTLYSVSLGFLSGARSLRSVCMRLALVLGHEAYPASRSDLDSVSEQGKETPDASPPQKN